MALKMLILEKMDIECLLKLSETNKLWNQLCKSARVWKKLYVKQFQDIPIRSDTKDFPWREKFIVKYKQDGK